MPGFGSLMAGRSSGYVQALLALAGMVLTLVFGLRFVLWFFANYARFHDAQADPLANFEQLWLAVRWALLGILIFILGWCWALITSLQIVAAAKKAEQVQAPPRLGGGPH
ncbi:MAG TPA: hypothetical protein VNZ22_15810 [Bacillota bacterium]|nr:hypothetical protein [Bacillota bacterium]